MKFLNSLLALFTAISSFNVSAKEENTKVESAYDFEFRTLIGDESLPLSSYKGKAILIVNTASKCGLTGQYEGLEKLYQTYKNKGLIILGVPSNDFGAQEPDPAKTIAEFCKLNYGVSFPMTQKEVVSGKQAHPFYRWAKEELGFGTAPKWNFHKYLINHRGELVDYFNSTTGPTSSNISNAIDAALIEEK